jgi:lipopolysaccharide export LptBFGC system permease protein LptF
MIVLIFVVVALVVLALAGWLLARARPGRTQRIKDAAAADVDAVREDAGLFSPDAPGNHQDDL